MPAWPGGAQVAFHRIGGVVGEMYLGFARLRRRPAARSPRVKLVALLGILAGLTSALGLRGWLGSRRLSS